ncbi:MAG: geranylgeranyl reductase family protein [Chloroflexota bacterium]
MPGDVSDVIVAGAGPAGSVTAILLARLGYQVRLVDARHFPRSKPCGEFMSPGVMNTLRRLDLEVALRQIPPRDVAGMNIIGPSGASMQVEYQVDGVRRDAITLRRVDLDTQLVRLAAAEGVEVCEGVRVRGPRLNDGTVVGLVASRHGQEDVMRARLTVVADGAQSALARALGLRKPARWPVRLGLVAHYEENPGFTFTHGQMHVGHGGYCGIAPLPDGRLNVAMVLRADAVRSSRLPAKAVFEQWIRSHRALAQDLEPHSRSSPVFGIGPVGSRAVRPWFPGALLVGDAAGFFDPFTGEGIFRALNGAEMAAQVAHDALTRGDVSASTLSAYGTLRSERFRDKQAVTSLVQLFVQYPRLMAYALPRLARRPVPYQALSGALGDLADAREFLRPSVLWSALRP